MQQAPHSKRDTAPHLLTASRITQLKIQGRQYIITLMSWLSMVNWTSPFYQLSRNTHHTQYISHKQTANRNLVYWHIHIIHNIHIGIFYMNSNNYNKHTNLGYEIITCRL